MASENGIPNAKQCNKDGTSEINGTKNSLNEIRDNMPDWKKALLKKRNEEVLAEIQKEKEMEEHEKKKYENLPSWKAEIIKRKDDEKRRQEELERQKAEEKEVEEKKFKMKPVWQQELIKRRSSCQNTA